MKTVTLFDTFERTNMMPMEFSGSLYEFYNNSGRQEIGLERDLFESWFSSYPEELKVRFKTQFVNQTHSAFFELFVRQLFVEVGFSCEVEPELGDKTPDFHMQKDGMEFFLECVTSTVDTPTEIKQNTRYANLMDYLNRDERLRTSGYFGWLEVNHKGSTSIKASEVARRCLQAMKAGKKILLYEQDDWEIEITLIEKKKPKETRFVGSSGVQTMWEGKDPFERFQKSIETKALKYDLGKPYFVAISLDDWAVDVPDEVMQILFGNKGWGLPSILRADKHTRVSGVLFFKNMSLSAPWKRDYVLVENPFAKYPVDFSSFDSFTRIIKSSEGKPALTKGKLLSEMVHVPQKLLKAYS